MSTTQDQTTERTLAFPEGMALDGISVTELYRGEPLMWESAEHHMEFGATEELALSISDLEPGRAAEVLRAFERRTFRLVYLNSGTVSDADILAVASSEVRQLKLGMINGAPAARLELDVSGESFARCKMLRNLGVYHCTFSDDHLGGVKSLHWLETLLLNDTVVTAAGLDAAVMPGLSALLIVDHYRTYGHMSSLEKWGGLRELSLERVGLIDEHLDGIASLKNLQILRLPYSDIFRRPFDGLAQLPDLSWLDLARTRVNDTTIESIGELLSLQRLDLSATAVTDAGLASLSGLRTLERLHLGNCDITDDGLARIVEQHPYLRVLDISRTLITPQAVPLLTRLPNLWRLEISQDDIAEALMEVDEFPALEEFGFRGMAMGNHWVGELVDHFGAANFPGHR